MRRFAFLLVTLLTIAQGTWASKAAPKRHFLTDMMVVGHDSKSEALALRDTYAQQGWQIIDQDLNNNAGGHYIYMLYKTTEHSENSGTAITDVYLRVSEHQEAPSSFVRNGCTYYLANYDGDATFKEKNGDLNCGAGGYWIHVYYTKDTAIPTQAKSISFSGDSYGAVGENGGSTPCDLNKDAGGNDIFMYVVYEKEVEYIKRSWDGTKVVGEKVKEWATSLNSLPIGHYDTRDEPGSYEDRIDLDGVYYVEGSRYIDGLLLVQANHGAKIILCDNADLNIKRSICLEDRAWVHIYGQELNTGKLRNESPSDCMPGIGISYYNYGIVEIHGGNIEVSGSSKAAGIGGGHLAVGDGLDVPYHGGECTVVIYDGTINATGGGNAAGIGGGFYANVGKVTIYSGDITAKGGGFSDVYWGGAGIGGGCGKMIDEVNIHGGKIYAKGGSDAAGIGFGEGISSTPVKGVVNITGGHVEAYGGNFGAGIGGGDGRYIEAINISGGYVYTCGGEDGAGIGGGEDAQGGTINISGGTVIAKGNYDSAGCGAGIGGGQDASGGKITISGGTVYAYGGSGAAGIGSGEETTSGPNIDGGNIIITGGSVNAYGNGKGCGIGGGNRAAMGNITITGGTIFAAGGEENGIWAGSIGGHDNTDGAKSLTIAERMEVLDTERSAMNYERYAFCAQRRVIAMAVCDHYGMFGTARFTDKGDGTHDIVNCQYCYASNEAHTYGSFDLCTRCVSLSLLSGSGTAEAPYLIQTIRDWGILSYYVERNPTQGMYFRQAADLAPNHVISSLANYYAFGGIYDGNGYTIDVSGIEGETNGIFPHIQNATIRRLRVKGTMTGSVCAGGLVGVADSTCLVEDCHVSSTITGNANATNGPHLGGIVGHGNASALTVLGCLFDGKLIASPGYTGTDKYAGAIVGWCNNATNIQTIDCLEDGTYTNFPNGRVSLNFDLMGNAASVKTANCYSLSHDWAYVNHAKFLMDHPDRSAIRPLSFYATVPVTFYSEYVTVGDLWYLTNGYIGGGNVGNIEDVVIDAYADNTELFQKYSRKLVNARLTGRTYQAKQNTDGTWQAYAYSVCLPFDMNLEDKEDVEVYKLQYIKDNSDFVFSRKAPMMYAGEPYLIVVRKGSVELKADVVQLVSRNTEGTEVIPWANHEDPAIGRWRGALQKIEHSDAASHNAYILQGDGTFKRIKATDNAWVGAFVSAFFPYELTGCDSYKIKLGEVYPGGGPEEEYTTDFPADFFVTDCDINDATGIDLIDNGQLTIDNSWYTLDGRKLDGKPTQKGVYIYKGKKAVVK